jgi:DNA processing protein
MINFSNFSPILPFREIVAYEALWAEKTTNFKSLANLFKSNPGSRPSDFVNDRKINEFYDIIKNIVLDAKLSYKPNLLINGTFDYPDSLKDAKEPVELLYYTGRLDYLHTRSIAIVGTRKPSQKSLEITSKLTVQLVEENFTIVSGLAEGIDTQAHTSAINAKGRTIAIIGTPLNKVYPKENASLQDTIAREHLLVSQVPFYRYTQQGPLWNKLFFPERNKTMSALTEATLIIEASDTSGTLTQATAALYQKRKLLIWDTCFQNKEITWPSRFLEKGAIRVRNFEEIKEALIIQDEPSLKN